MHNIYPLTQVVSESQEVSDMKPNLDEKTWNDEEKKANSSQLQWRYHARSVNTEVSQRRLRSLREALDTPRACNSSKTGHLMLPHAISICEK